MALVRLLHEILVPLLLRKSNSLLLGAEVEVGALHEVARRLPAHQLVLPPVALFEDVPVHAPQDAGVGGLGGGFGGEEDAVVVLVRGGEGKKGKRKGERGDNVPDGASLKFHGSTGDDGGREDTLLGTILDVLGDWGPGAAV